MDESYRRNSRRSDLNLQHLSITPLTPQYPLPPTIDSPTNTFSAQTSYIASKSVPQSPSVLSRSSSRTKLHPQGSRSSHALADLAGNFPLKSTKSSSNLPRRTSSSTNRLKNSESTDWLIQTASVLATSTAESKGQLWLTTRTSSTSLVDSSSVGRQDAAYKADDEYSPLSTRHVSRPQSRFASARNSRRGSRVGIVTSKGIKTPGERENDEDEVDEGEMRRVVWGKVEGWVDWAVGWMDFRNEDEGGEGRGTAVDDVGENEKREKMGRRKKRDETDRVLVKSTDEPAKLEVPPPPEEEGILSDAVWLVGLAKKVIL